MTERERYDRLKSLYLEVRSLPATERIPFLETECAGDPTLRKSVEELLSLDSELITVLETGVGAGQTSLEVPPLTAGSRVGHYEIEEQIGRGGMGVVFRARDLRLGRRVALKFLGLLPESTPPPEDAVERFVNEARAASALDHPNVCTVHDFGVWEGHTYLAMTFYPGQTLENRLQSGPLPVEETLDIALQVVDGLAAAHAEGIVHRDVKPGNVMIGERGLVKILDFGLATHPSQQRLTRTGLTVGTPGSMAPEQIRGQEATPATDVWGVGVLLYEMLVGDPPFRRDSLPAIVYATVHEEPRDLRTERPETPEWLAKVVTRCLRKDPAERFADAGEVGRALSARRKPHGRGEGAETFQRRIAAAVTVAVLAAIAISAVVLVPWWRQESQRRWLHTEAVPEIRRLTAVDPAAAYRLAHNARQASAEDPQLEQLWLDLTLPVTITSEPPGAEVAIRGYLDQNGEWLPIGRTPLEDIRLPHTLLRLRLTLEGRLPVEAAPSLVPVSEPFHLFPPEATPEGMVAVPPGPVRFLDETVELPAFWIDLHEVTNRQFRRFIDEGGYRRPELWRFPVEEDGQVLSREEAMARFVDSTGMPGPATWALGIYREGEDDHPVEGVSWYEAAAYAEHVGKSLPTVFHWYRAAGLGTRQNPNFSDILVASNFGGKATTAVGTLGGLGPYGTLDMAGNVKEWCANGVAERRFILGGSWLEPPYQYRWPDAQHPLERLPGFGFRLVRQSAPLVSELFRELEAPEQEIPPPVDDTTFAHFARLFDYDSTPLEARVEEIDDRHEAWLREIVTFDAAYPGERVIVHLFLPRNVSPPYQTVLHFPAGYARMLSSIREAPLSFVEPFLRSGRAVAYPIYQGTFERQVTTELGPVGLRNLLAQQVKDLRRTVDYLETRPDIDSDRLAFSSLSYGTFRAPYALAVERRIRAAMLQSGGILVAGVPQEVQQQDFLPRLSIPVLLVTGRDDFTFPYEQSQRPFFELLGTPADQKRHAVLDGGHIPTNHLEVVREILAWADRWLGPVRAEVR